MSSTVSGKYLTMHVMAITITNAARAAFGEQLKTWRETQGVTQQELATKLGCAMSAISKWERGDKYPRMLNVKRLIRELTGLDPDAIAKDYEYNNGR